MTEIKKITLPQIDLSFMRDIEITPDESGLRATEVTGINGSGGRTTYSDLQNEFLIYTKTVYYAKTDRKKYECSFYEGKEHGAYTSYYNEEGSPKKEVCTLNPENPDWHIGDDKVFDKNGKLIHHKFLNDKNEAVGAYMEVVEGGDVVKGTKHPSGNGEWISLRTISDADGNKLEEKNFNDDGKQVSAYWTLLKDDAVLQGQKHPSGNGCNVGRMVKTAADGKTVLLELNFDDNGVLQGQVDRRFADGSTINGTIRSGASVNSDVFMSDKTNPAIYGNKHPYYYKIWNFVGDYRETWGNGNVKTAVTLKEQYSSFFRDHFINNASGYFYEGYEDGTTKRVGNADTGQEFEFYPDGRPLSERVVDENGKYKMTLSWAENGDLTVTRFDEKNSILHMREIFKANSHELIETQYINGGSVRTKDDFKKSFPDQTLTKNKVDITKIDFRGKSPHEAVRLVPKSKPVHA